MIAAAVALLPSGLTAATNTVSTPAGFVRLELPPASWRFSAMPFVATDPGIAGVFSNQLTGAVDQNSADHIQKWNLSGQVYTNAYKYINGAWYVDFTNFTPSPMSFNPGDGFIIYNNRQSVTQTVFLCGKVVLDGVNTQSMPRGLTLFGYPFSTARKLNDTDFANDGAYAASAFAQADQVSIWDSVLGQYRIYGLKSNDRKWHLTTKWSKAATDEYLPLGSGQWYRRQPTNGFQWTETRPYEQLYPTNGNPPVITGMRPNAQQDEMTLSIDANGIGTLEIYYKDLEATNVFASLPVPGQTGTGWKIAAMNVTGGGNIEWTDEGTGGLPGQTGRGKVNTVVARYYLCGNSGIDTDGDGLPDSRETFVLGSDPAVSSVPAIDNAGGATNIGLRSAYLCANLTSTGGAPTTVRIHWGLSDGGTDKSAWSSYTNKGVLSTGVCSSVVTGLTVGTKYYYRACASNAYGERWAAETTNFTTLGVAQWGLISVDFNRGTNYGTYSGAAAVGSAGDVWNGIAHADKDSPPAAVNVALLNYSSNLTGVTLTESGAMSTKNAPTQWTNSPYKALMSDVIGGKSIVTLSGLAPGSYRLYLYAGCTNVMAWNVNGSNTASTFGGNNTALSNHTLHVVATVTNDQKLVIKAPIGWDTSKSNYVCNGFQLTQVPIVLGNTAATGISKSTARMNGTMVSTVRTPTCVWLYWGATDGTNNPAAWSNVVNLGALPVGPFSTATYDLQPDSLYYYRYFASNSVGTAWAVPTTNFTTLANHPPVAEAGSNQVVEGTSPAGASVILDGSGSSDPDDISLNYTWKEGTTTLAAHNDPVKTATVTLALGVHTITLAVSDGQYTNTDTVVVTVRDTTPPVVTVLPGTDTVVCYTVWTDAGATATDICAGNLTVTVSGTVNTNQAGTYLVTYSATDPSGNSNSATRTVTVTKATPVVSATGGTFTYDGSPHAGYGSATGGAGEILAVTLSYTGTGSTIYGPTAIAPTAAGTYTVTASTAGDGNNMAGSSSPALLTINVAPPVVSNAAATGITARSALMNGTVMFTGQAQTHVWLYWGTNDAHDVINGWGNTNCLGLRGIGALTTNITGMTDNTTYYYRYFAANSAGTVWAAPSMVFTTLTATNFYWANAEAGNWSADGNWTNEFGPGGPTAAGGRNYSLNFNAAGTYASEHDLNNGFLLNRLSLNGPALSLSNGPAVTLAGNSLAFANSDAVLPQLNQNSASGVTIRNNLTLSADTTFGGAGSGQMTVSGAISGSGSLTKTGAGTLTLSFANTYSGGTRLNGGILQLGVANALPTNGPASAMDGGTLDLNGFPQTLTGLSGASGAVTNSSAATDATLTLTVAGGTTETTGAVLLNGDAKQTSLIVNGPGAQVVSSASNSVAKLTIGNNGSLRIDDSVAASPSLTSAQQIDVGLDNLNAGQSLLLDIDNATVNCAGITIRGKSGQVIVRGNSTFNTTGNVHSQSDNTVHTYIFKDNAVIHGESVWLRTSWTQAQESNYIALQNNARALFNTVELIGNGEYADGYGHNTLLEVQDSAQLTASANMYVMRKTRDAGRTGICRAFAQVWQHGGTVTVGGDLSLCEEDTVKSAASPVHQTWGAYNLGSGSSLNVGGRITGGAVRTGVGQSYFNFHGGTLTYTGAGPQPDWINLTASAVTDGIDSAQNLRLWEGATIDTGSRNVTINQALLAPSGQGISAIATTGLTTPVYNNGMAPWVYITRGAGDTTGSGAGAVATLDAAGHVNGIVISNPGNDYTATPSILLIRGQGTTQTVPAGNIALSDNSSYTGGLTKTGAGTLTLTAINTYCGPTIVSNGVLALTVSNCLRASPDLYVYGGATCRADVGEALNTNMAVRLYSAAGVPGRMNLMTAGTANTVKALYIDGVAQGAGTWGATGSGARHIDDAWFAGSGVLRVVESGVVMIENTAATGIASNAVWMNGNLISTGIAPAHVWVCWATNDCGTNAWPNSEDLGIMPEGTLSTHITGLSCINTTYYYRYYASNDNYDGVWATPSVSVGGTADSDGDGMPDGWELIHGLNPNANDASQDADNDGLGNLEENRHGTDPAKADTDDDGLSDWYEVHISGTNPARSDTANDGLGDGWKMFYGLNPQVYTDPNADSDGDDWTNLQEYQHGTDPNVADSDGDGLNDPQDANPLRADQGNTGGPAVTIDDPAEGQHILW